MPLDTDYISRMRKSRAYLSLTVEFRFHSRNASSRIRPVGILIEWTCSLKRTYSSDGDDDDGGGSSSSSSDIDQKDGRRKHRKDAK